MKTVKFLLLLLVTAHLISCSDHANDPRVKNITSSGCKSRSNSSTLEDPEGLSYEVKEGVLIITLYNYHAPCDLTKMGADISIEKDKIILTPKELDGGYVNCICPMDFTFPVTGLVTGAAYQCTINQKDLPISFEFTFKEGAKGMINPYEN